MGSGASSPAGVGEATPAPNKPVVAVQPPPSATIAAVETPAAKNLTSTVASCYKKKSFDDDTYWDGFKEHVNGFIHASMADHKKCFKSKYQKVFRRSQIAANQEDSEGKGAKSSLPLQSTSTSLVKG